MKKTPLIAMLVTSSLVFGFDFGALVKEKMGTQTPAKTATKTQTTSTSNLSDSVVNSGLKEALNAGVTYATTELGKKDGYLNNKAVKIPLPENLAKVESIIRSAGGDKIADDLIVSMNNAASNAAPKTAAIFMDAIKNMSIDDAKKILLDGDDAATQYFKTNTTGSLKEMIKPIVQKSMEENKVAGYYETANGFYQSNVKETVESSKIMGMAKQFGADSYLPTSSQSIEDYVTEGAINGLFKMIGEKEQGIRENPIEQTTSILKKVFG